MRRNLALSVAALSATFLATQSIAEDVLWAPTDYEGAWVIVRDDAENGCWTNIGESSSYAADQMELAGFDIVERPAAGDGKPSPILTENHVALVIHVRGSRWNDGLCVGHVSTYFIGSVVPRMRQDELIVSTIGTPYTWTIWDEENLNNYVLDHIKGAVPAWVEAGQIDDDD